MFNNFGFVFTGGGAKGAWQLGVWKAFEEKGYRAKAVSGTSVGALNACLYAQGNYQKALNAWNEINQWKILHPDLFNIIMKGMVLPMAKQSFLMMLRSSTLPVASLILSFLGSDSKEKGVCLQDGLRKLIEEYLDLNNRKNWLPTFICAHDIKNFRPKYFRICPQDDWSSEEIVNILLASSAMPKIFSSVTIRGEEYNDGGGGVLTFLFDCDSCEYDNAPKAPLQKLSLDLILLLELDYKKHNEYIKRISQGTCVAQIVPSKYLGNFIDGTVNFDKVFVSELVELGYNDGVKWLKENMVHFELMEMAEKSSNTFNFDF